MNQLGQDASELPAPLGAETVDVYLSGRAYRRNVPEAVWEYTLGGYPVLKKWLSYREEAVLGRGLGPDEARTLTQIARRITAILLLGPELDANYRAVAREGYAWPTASTGPKTLRLWWSNVARRLALTWFGEGRRTVSSTTKPARARGRARL